MIATPATDERYQLVELDEDHVKAHAFNMLFMVWRRRTLEAPFRRAILLVNELAVKFHRGNRSLSGRGG